MNNFVMLIGLPASGKSKMASRYKEKGYVVHSSDGIRSELFGDSTIQKDHNKVFTLLHQRIKDDMNVGYDVVYDATNISAKRRIQFLNEIKKYNYNLKALVMATPYNNCVENDRNRDNSVGYQAIYKMLRQWQLPNYHEGWNEIEIKYWHDIDYDFYFNLHKLSFDINQYNNHHTMTIGGHMHSVASMILEADELNDLVKDILSEVALYHDLGKIIVQNFIDSKGYIGQNAHFYNHENISSYFGMFIFEGLNNMIEICNIIQYHMKPTLLTTEKSVQKIKNIVGERIWELLTIFNEYDKRGK